MSVNKTNKRRLGVNIDHIATLREARKVTYPSPREALAILKQCRVDQVTLHLREDRRHIQDHDLKEIIRAKALPVNLEMAVTDEMIRIAVDQRPQTVTFVPERREEVTTEGGLDCSGQLTRVREAVQVLKKRGIRCSLFIDPDDAQVEASKSAGADAVEIHTGAYCNSLEDFYHQSGSYDFSKDSSHSEKITRELSRVREASQRAVRVGLRAFAGHGLHTGNLLPVCAIPEIEEYNIGHAIIARSVFVGLQTAIHEIQEILGQA